jgi:PAS domain S-box-containing protein/putative nucleotidyltransferase with HDIG domain
MEEIFKTLVEKAADGIVVVDPQGIILYANPAAADLFGRPASQLTGLALGFPPAGAGTTEIEITRQARSPVLVEILPAECVWDGQPAVLATLRDVTRRKRAEIDARRQERELADAQRVAHLGSWTFDPATGASVWSPEMFRIYGLEPAAEAPPPAERAAHMHPDDRALSKAVVDRALAEGIPYEAELRILWLDGSIRTIVSRGEPQRDARGRIIQLLGTVLDVTERKQIENRLREREREYNALFNQGRDAIFVADVESGIILKANAAAVRLLRRPQEEIVGSHQSDFHPPEMRDFYSGQFLKRARTDAREAVEAQVVAADGERIPVEISSSVTVLPDGRRVVQSLFRDVRERRAAEEKNRENVEKLRRALGGTIGVITAVVERRDPYTGGHQRRASDLARFLATDMGLDSNRVEGVRLAAAIHDIGKVSVPAEILSKTTKLSDLEMMLVRSHAQVGFEIVKDVVFPWPIARIILEHHERLDGSGYPGGLRGDALLLESRILAVSDVVEAMASHRPYRPAHGIETALREIEAGRGRLYDADAADACLRLFREKGYRLVD